MAFTDYNSGSGGQAGESNNAAPASGDDTYWTLERLKRSYLDFLGSKREEIKEQQDARRYRHCSQWTSAQITILNKRKQPIVTNNVISRKINGVIGLIEKLRQAPKGYARTPKEEGGADLATAVVRYVLDEQRWKEKSPVCAEAAAVDGYGGIEITIEQGDMGDPEIGFEAVDSDEFFYDPRSYKGDFSDCRFMGRAKWIDLEAAKDMFPDKADALDDSLGDEPTTNSDREQKWFFSEENVRRVRVVDEWYKKGKDWYWCMYTGTTKLQEGKSPFVDEKKKTFCKFIMFSSYVDQDGDRYGFIRNLKSLQDEINQRRSKALHLLNQRRIIAEDGAFDDVEKARVEAARADAVVIYNKGFEAKFDDQVKMLETDSQLKFLQEAKEELEQFGPTLSLIGDTGQNQSGRAISLQQQAGIAQLGPFMVNYKSWKLRVYRAIWNAVKTNWTAERWIRVTDDENSVNYVGLNQIGINPQTGMPAMVNQISALDVDIVLDEGPDSINMMADTFDALNAIAQNGAQIPPDVLIELAPGIDSATRKRILDRLRRPDPMEEQAKQLELAQVQAKIAETQAATGLKKAQTIDVVRGDQGGQGPEEHPAVTQANVENTMADTALKKAQAMTTLMKPSQEEQKQHTDLAMKAHDAERDRQLKLHEQDNKMRSESDKLRREEELHQFDMQERQMRFRMEVDQHEHQKQMDQRDTGQMVETRKSKAATKQKTEAGLAQAINALAQSSRESSNAIVKATNVLAESAQVMAKAATSPKRIVRGKDGRVSHVETG